MNRTESTAGSQDARVRRGARLLRYGVLSGVVVLLVTTSAALLIPQGAHSKVAAIIDIHEQGMPYVAAVGVAVLLCGLLSVGLIHLIRMLRRLESGELFSPRVTQDLRAFTLFALLSAVVSTVGSPAIRLISMLWQGGTARLTLGADSSDIWLLLFTALLFLVARLLDEAIRIVDDHKQIV
jgi:hypothetical protein